jgi:hypothetical protein
MLDHSTMQAILSTHDGLVTPVVIIGYGVLHALVELCVDVNYCPVQTAWPGKDHVGARGFRRARHPLMAGALTCKYPE